MTPRARAIIMTVSDEHKVPFEKIIMAGRVQKVFRARMEAAKRLSALPGYTSPRIAKILGCDHTMILYYLGRLKKKPSKPVWRAPKVKRLYVNAGIKLGPRPKPAPLPGLYLIPYAGADRFDYIPTPRQPMHHCEESSR